MQLHIGLTGGIGAGKSTVANMLAQLGAHIIDADKLAREVMEPGGSALKKIARTFGPQYISSTGELDRKALGKHVFNRPEELIKLNQIVHPAVGELTQEKLAEAHPDAIIVHDIPLLTENQLQPHYHVVLVVYADTQTRLQRLVDQRSMTRSDAQARIAAQASDEERRAIADAIISTQGSVAETARQVEQLWENRIEPMHHNMAAKVPAVAMQQSTLVPNPGPPRTWHQQATGLIQRLEYLLDRAGLSSTDDFLIDHIGSTAIPGMWARDEIELQIRVTQSPLISQVSAALTSAGYPPLQGKHQDVIHGSADPARSFTIYIRAADSPAAAAAIEFRQRLRADISQRFHYGRFQARLARNNNEVVDDAQVMAAFFDAESSSFEG